MNPQQIASLVQQTGFVPLFTHTDISICRNVLKASYDAGVRLFEFTNRNANSFDIFIELRKYCSEQLPGMVLGIGTIKNAQQANQFIRAGADFLISPLILEEIQQVAAAHKKLWIPGCATASEIGLAEYWGIDTVKIFPARQLGGPAFIKAVKAVFPAMRFMATGGVEPTAEDIGNWFKGGVAAVGIGSQLFPAEWLANGEYALVTGHIKKIMQYIEKGKT
ncbi:bifunctional 4-hydroxy-2-oxoglutarate aldolase/2-dehydro-3-deoxy-phosphogluconate aldolase [Agriterribacter sp.]|uniref:bifunctional 4-hydroxy-2-oxoglutarate aldolase/2-dehydro-3-deoxy-phosphogluconate aldolase n=1 Tax=Agriterribacter sp. TaxID=2821509 RepID=UPI002B79CCED|nr:bifunctional 4-hydroxy-2-oxoglutarate aldolase/2-dehydro-3-deoxy-phosphogluconate aldolase [Agriterribacter sp.]HRO45614.1 bifunctional 4-hydroxy-2-oxoglutarate aldolase/2-dehydro-3-deoxy-phosphogluconate aldolase [Agriterribacter sp.]HRQ17435.1 bifunctional 4-hydroxy-2-oxoglutarate aldolase/2-dehydro-3-deoxy-phosphogluconate aldolase [Agriterribacter sp.]